MWSFFLPSISVMSCMYQITPQNFHRFPQGTFVIHLNTFLLSSSVVPPQPVLPLCQVCPQPTYTPQQWVGGLGVVVHYARDCSWSTQCSTIVTAQNNAYGEWKSTQWTSHKHAWRRRGREGGNQEGQRKEMEKGHWGTGISCVNSDCLSAC